MNSKVEPLFRGEHFFGQDFLVEKLSHAAIERGRVTDENAMLREKVDHLRESLRLADADLDNAERENAKLEKKLAKLKRKLSRAKQIDSCRSSIVSDTLAEMAELEKVISAHQAQEALLLARCERAESGQEEADRIENLRIYREMVAA